MYVIIIIIYWGWVGVGGWSRMGGGGGGGWGAQELPGTDCSANHVRDSERVLVANRTDQQRLRQHSVNYKKKTSS